MKLRLTLETDTKRLFETKKSLVTRYAAGNADVNGTPGVPNAQIVLLKTPYIQYKELTLSTNFRQYLETILFSSKVLRMGIQKTPCQKTYKLQTGQQDFTVDFIGINRQFDCVELLLVYDKSNKHLTICDSYNAKCAAKLVKSLDFVNVSEEHSATNMLKCDTTNDLHKHLLYKQFLVWHTDGYSTAPLTGFMNNPVAQELKDEEDYFSNDSDKRIYVDYTHELEKLSRNDSKMRITIELKNALAKKMRLRVWGYSNGEYLYMQKEGSLILKYKTYTSKSLCNELEK